MNRIKNYIDALNATIKLIVGDSVSDENIQEWANVLYHKIMEDDSPDYAACYVVGELLKRHKAEKNRIESNYNVEHSTKMADRFAVLLGHLLSKIQNLSIPVDEDTLEYYNYLKSLGTQPQPLPDELNNDVAKEYLQRLVNNGFCDSDYRWNNNKTQYQATWAADHISKLLKLKNKWKPFETLWGFKNMAQTFYNENLANADSIKEIHELFPEVAPKPKNLEKL